MASTRNLFRDYLTLRARAVVIIAIALAVLGLFGLGIFISRSADHITRFGLVLQFLGIVFVLPHVVGKHKFGWLWINHPRPVVPVTAGEPPQPAPQPAARPEQASESAGEPVAQGESAAAAAPESTMAQSAVQAVEPAAPEKPGAPDPAFAEGLVRSYEAINREIMLGNILAALGLIGLLVAVRVWPELLVFENALYILALLGLVGFAWLNLFMLIQIYRIFHTAIPRGMLAGFFFMDFLLGFLGAIFGAVLHIIERWLGGGVSFTFQNGFRRVLLMATLPFLLTGLGLEMLATFLP